MCGKLLATRLEGTFWCSNFGRLANFHPWIRVGESNWPYLENRDRYYETDCTMIEQVENAAKINIAPRYILCTFLVIHKKNSVNFAATTVTNIYQCTLGCAYQGWCKLLIRGVGPPWFGQLLPCHRRSFLHAWFTTTVCHYHLPSHGKYLKRPE